MTPSTPTPPGSVGLLGYGHFGRALAELILDADLSIRACDPVAGIPRDQRAATPAHLAESCELIILAVPIPAFGGVLADLRPHLHDRNLVIDVASVKRPAIDAMTELLGTDIPWVATHPLFGPASIARGERPLRAVVCPSDLHPAAAARARSFYERLGCDVTQQDADEHDRLMADTHALAFFVAKAMLEIGAGRDDAPTPPSFAAMNTTIETVRADAGHLFFPIQSANPFAAEARERLLDALLRVHRQLADARDAPQTAAAEAMSIPAPPATPPELLETRDLIDELDRELVELLARRANLSHRAARTKADHGKSVQDPAREKTLLEARQQWGRERGLGEESIADIFEAILRFSRAEQRRGG